jgi:hypothetical protein
MSYLRYLYAAIGHAVVAPLRRVMNSRRLIASLSPRITPYHSVEKAVLCITAKWVSGCRLRSKAA